MAAEDFTTYDEFDSHARLTFTADRATFNHYPGSAVTHLYKDFGAGYFSGDFEHQLEFHYTEDGSRNQYGYPGWISVFMLSTENSGRVKDIIDGGHSAIGINFNKPWNSHRERSYLFEVYGGIKYQSVIGTGTLKYTRLKRVNNILTLTFYTDANYSVEAGSVSLTLHGTPSYRYVNIGGGYDTMYYCWIDGFTQNLSLAPSIITPTVTTNPATDVAANSSTLNGTLDDDGGEACDCGFEWGETIAYGNTTSTQSKETGESFLQAISGLSPGITHHFRAFATNSQGTSYGSDRTFTTTLVAPSLTTNPATEVSILNGTLDDDGGEACDCGFEWGETIAYGNTTSTQSKETGETFAHLLGELSPATTYHFRAFATNSQGTSYGSDQSLTTPAGLPTLTTEAASAIGLKEATLNGALTSDGGEPCYCGFDWGATIAYGNVTPTQRKVTGEVFSQPLLNLGEAAQYHFRAFATNPAGTAYGEDRTIDTLFRINKAYALARYEV